MPRCNNVRNNFGNKSQKQQQRQELLAEIKKPTIPATTKMMMRMRTMLLALLSLLGAVQGVQQQQQESVSTSCKLLQLFPFSDRYVCTHTHTHTCTIQSRHKWMVHIRNNDGCHRPAVPFLTKGTDLLCVFPLLCRDVFFLQPRVLLGPPPSVSLTH